MGLDTTHGAWHGAYSAFMPRGDSGGHIGDYRDKTQQFIDGLRRAAAANEPLGFH
jgi:hypothetical protein